MSKYQNAGINIETIRFLTSKAKMAFIQASILRYFDLKCYIQIETSMPDYIISDVLIKLILDNLGQ